MTTVTIQIKGIDQLLRKLDPKRYEKAMRTSMRVALDLPRADMKHYPKKSDANRPRTSWSPGGDNRWYHRGFGPKWIRKDGTVKGIQSSEILSKKWTKAKPKIGRRAAGLVGTIGISSSYAQFVQDAGEQAGFHKARGWKTVQDALKDSAGKIKRVFEQAIRRELNRK